MADETPIQKKLKKTGPRKLLALDGGGILGVIGIEVLAKLEEELRKRQPPETRAAFVLADYFDYVAGTSTGAIIATCISLGFPVAKIRTFYHTEGPRMFSKDWLLKRYLHRYSDDNLTAILQREIGADTTLGTHKLRTLLLAVMRNATTDSPWPLSNNPAAMFNLPGVDGRNLDLPLWQLVRASTAAPTYFPPEVIKVGSQEFIFVDGGVTVYNNPAFQLFLMSTVKVYGLSWPAGEDKLLLVSVGTGSAPDANERLLPSDMNLLYHATRLPSALIASAVNEQDFLCRVFGKCLCGDPLDLEVNAMIHPDGAGPVSPKLFTYLRYDAQLTSSGLAALGVGDIDAAAVRQMDAVKYIPELQRIGEALARKRVDMAHYAGFLN